MIKLKNILNEVLNTFSVQAFMLTDSNFNITDILEQIRAIRKITIVRNITPPEYIQKKNIEYTLVNIKFVKFILRLFTYSIFSEFICLNFIFGIFPSVSGINSHEHSTPIGIFNT